MAQILEQGNCGAARLRGKEAQLKLDEPTNPVPTWGHLIFVLLTELSPLLLFAFPLPQQSFKPSDR
jgi:hypothetical protein